MGVTIPACEEFGFSSCTQFLYYLLFRDELMKKQMLHFLERRQRLSSRSSLIALAEHKTLRTLGDVTSYGGDNYTLVIMWTQPDGDGVWATDAAAALVNDGLFDDPSAAQLSLVAYGDAYVNNSYSCGSGNVWSEAGAACWLSNCSEPWPMTKPMTSGACYGYPASGSAICTRGSKMCDILRWQAFIWLHYLTVPTLVTPYYACLQAGAANASQGSADNISERCAKTCHVSQSMFEHLRDDYVHTWRAQEALAGNALIQSWHLRRADTTHGPAWPLIQIGGANTSPAHPARTYSGPHTKDGLKSAVCASIASGAARLPDVCKSAASSSEL